MQPEERLQSGGRDLGDHLARSVRVETIDHHAVEAVQHLELARGLLRQFGQRPWSCGSRLEHQPDHFSRIGVVLDHARAPPR